VAKAGWKSPGNASVIFREHRCAYSEGSEKRKENQPQQDCQSWLAIEHCGKARTLESALQFTVRSADSSSTNAASFHRRARFRAPQSPTALLALARR